MRRCHLLAACLGLLGLFLPSLRADQWDKRTTITIAEPIQVPNKVLPPGVYVMKLLDSPSNRHIVQIFTADETELLTTILAIPNYRLQPTGKTIISFWEMPAGQPRAMRAWFYPGDNFGQEFAYPKSAAITIAQVSRAEVPSIEAIEQPELETAPVITIQPPAEEPAIAFETPAPPPPEPVVNEAERQAPPPALPRTGSAYPLIGVAGVLCLAVFAGLRIVRVS